MSDEEDIERERKRIRKIFTQTKAEADAWNEDVFRAGGYDKLMINKSRADEADLNTQEQDELLYSLVKKREDLTPSLNNPRTATSLWHKVYDNPLCARYHPVGMFSGKITACVNESGQVCPAFKTNTCMDFMNMVETRGVKKDDVLDWLDKKIDKLVELRTKIKQRQKVEATQRNG